MAGVSRDTLSMWFTVTNCVSYMAGVSRDTLSMWFTVKNCVSYMAGVYRDTLSMWFTVKNCVSYLAGVSGDTLSIWFTVKNCVSYMADADLTECSVHGTRTVSASAAFSCYTLLTAAEWSRQKTFGSLNCKQSSGAVWKSR